MNQDAAALMPVTGTVFSFGTIEVDVGLHELHVSASDADATSPGSLISSIAVDIHVGESGRPTLNKDSTSPPMASMIAMNIHVGECGSATLNKDSSSPSPSP
jgi:hypothetical protein